MISEGSIFMAQTANTENPMKIHKNWIFIPMKSDNYPLKMCNLSPIRVHGTELKISAMKGP